MGTSQLTNCFLKLSEQIDKLVENTEDFLTSNVNDQALKNSLKTLYDQIYCSKLSKSKNALPELIIDAFSHEEIWPQIELHNKDHFLWCISNVHKLESSKDNLVKTVNSVSSKSDSDSDNESCDTNSNNEPSTESKIKIPKNGNQDVDTSLKDLSDEPSEHSEETNVMRNEVDKSKKSVVDDDFFKLDEMETFLKYEEKKIEAKAKPCNSDSEDEDSVDMFALSDENETLNDDKDDKAIKYSDFFGSSHNESQREKYSENEDSDESEKFSDDEALSDVENDKDSESSEEDMQNPSRFEMRQAKLKKENERLENKALEEKPWQLKGETDAKSRPENSLLEEDLEFDVAAKPKLIVTEKTNLELEDIIIQRIKDRAWDSVKRKVKFVEQPHEFKKKLALDQEKSKESLAQIYEKEYLKQKEILDPDNIEKEEENLPMKVACSAAVDNLFMKLDALSHFYFTPKLAKPEIKIISNLPAINIEEVAPVATSDATLLAPEEVSKKTKGPVMVKEERTKTDKNRERRKKKKLQHRRAINHQPKDGKTRLLKEVTRDRNISKMETNSDVVKSSGQFFSLMQDQTKQQSQSRIAKRKINNTSNQLSSKKLKL